MQSLQFTFRGLVVALFLALAPPLAVAEEAAVQIEISGLAEASGNLYISVYDSSDTWLGEETVLTTMVSIEEARDGELVRARLSLAPGDYAISIFHDSNGNGDLDTNFIGIPKEPVALSNNARPKFGPPKYKDAVFTLAADGVVQRIDMTDI